MSDDIIQRAISTKKAVESNIISTSQRRSYEKTVPINVLIWLMDAAEEKPL